MKYLVNIVVMLLLAQACAYAQGDDYSIDWMRDEISGAGESEAPAAMPAGDFRLGWVDYKYVNTVTPDAPWHRTSKGIFVVDSGDRIRSFDTFAGSDAAARGYAGAVNRYYELFGDRVTIWVMPIITASSYYTPDEAMHFVRPVNSFLKAMYDALDSSVRFIDLYPVLAAHVSEPVYSRTDHHWAPLGAYYAARVFASLAGVPFPDLSHYDRHVVPDYVGTMAKFSGDPELRRHPEDFVYYTPRDVNVKTTYITYTLDKARRNVISAKGPEEGRFFLPFKGVSTYCTFMGGDQKITKVETSADNGRRLLILKDSFGNALPGYLFSSFEQIHVIDCRYFTKNMKEYVADNGITDILFANNVTHAANSHTYNKYLKYLEQ